MKIKNDVCLRCGFDPKLKEKSVGCYVYGDLIDKKHLYTYDDSELLEDNINEIKLNQKIWTV